jgi:hypothetical protein
MKTPGRSQGCPRSAGMRRAPHDARRRPIPARRGSWVAAIALSASFALGAQEPPAAPVTINAAVTSDYANDGRLPLWQVQERFGTLASDHRWLEEEVYAYPDDPTLVIRAWRTPHEGEALWILAGIHGEEPAGPNAIARQLPTLVRLAESGVPVVVLPLCNPKAYRHNWRYPNTAERDSRKGGYSVGDAGYLLPDLDAGQGPREPEAPGPETEALTQHVLGLARLYPPRLVLDLHEDELSRDGGYIYSQGVQARSNPVGADVVRLLQQAGIPLRMSGKTRFGEPVVAGVVSRDEKGQPIRDSSIDELLAATEVIVDGKKVRGPAARTVIVVETPAFEGSEFERRVAAHALVLESADALWRRSGEVKAR